MEPNNNVSQEPEQPQQPSEESTSAAVSPANVQEVSRPQHKRWPLILVLVIAVAAVAGVYFWLNSEVNSSKQENSRLQDKVSQLEAAQATNEGEVEEDTQDQSDVTPESSDSVVTGQIYQEDSESNVLVECYIHYQSGVLGEELTLIGVNYGTTTDLNIESPTKDIIVGGPGSGEGYHLYTIELPVDKVMIGTSHYYQCVATDKNNQKAAGGMAHFTAKK